MPANDSQSELVKSELAPTRATLLARLKDLDDQQSWQEFFNIYQRLLYGRVLNCGLPPQDAEEVVAEIVEGVARRMPEFVYDPQRCSFKTWLFRIVARRVADYYRRRAHALPQVAMDSDARQLLEQAPDPATLEPDRKWEEAWEANLVRATLEAVRRRANPRYFQLYLYCVVEDHSITETARDLQASASKVYLAKHRITKLLREEGERLRRDEKIREDFGL